MKQLRFKLFPSLEWSRTWKRLRHMQRFIHFVLTFPGSSFTKLQGRHTVKHNSWHASLLQTSTWTWRGGRVVVWIGAVFYLLWVKWNSDTHQQWGGRTTAGWDKTLLWYVRIYWRIQWLFPVDTTTAGAVFNACGIPKKVLRCPTELYHWAEDQSSWAGAALSRQSFIYFKFHQLASCTLAGIVDFFLWQWARSKYGKVVSTYTTPKDFTKFFF